MDASLVKTAAISNVSEGVVAGEEKKRKRRLKKKSMDAEFGDDIETGSEPKRTKVPRAKHLRQEFITFASDMEKDMDDLITSARQHPFISDAVILLETLLGLDGGMSELLQDKGVKVDTTEMFVDEGSRPRDLLAQILMADGQRKGKEVVGMIDDDDDKGKDETEEGVILTAGEVAREPFGKKVRKTVHPPNWDLQSRNPIFTRQRLRIPSNTKDFLDVMLGLATHAALKAIERIPRKHECYGFFSAYVEE
ncbi:hypothetical protein Dimus_003500 [Dionaea muscipula]